MGFLVFFRLQNIFQNLYWIFSNHYDEIAVVYFLRLYCDAEVDFFYVYGAIYALS